MSMLYREAAKHDAGESRWQNPGRLHASITGRPRSETRAPWAAGQQEAAELHSDHSTAGGGCQNGIARIQSGPATTPQEAVTDLSA